MKRKVIKQGHNTLTITLPKKWCDSFNVKGGDEIEIDEISTGLNIQVKGPSEGFKIEINCKGIDRTTLKYFLRFSYRNGCDEMVVLYPHMPKIYHFRTNEEKDVISVINEEVAQLIGMDVIEQNDRLTRIKKIIKEDDNEFYPTFKRIFYILYDGFNDFSKLILTKESRYLLYLKQKHDIATKSLNYLFRLLNKIRGYTDQRKVISFTTLYYLESIFDTLEHLSLYPPNLEEVNSKNFRKILIEMESFVNLFKSSYMRSDFSDSIELQKKRNIIETEIRNYKKNLTGEEGRIIGLVESMINIFRALMGLRICTTTLETTFKVEG